MCRGLLCNPNTNHKFVREWSKQLPFTHRQRSVLEIIRTVPVRQRLVNLLCGACEQDNPRVRFWQQCVYAREDWRTLGTLSQPVGNMECKQCWLMKNVKPYFEHTWHVMEVIKICHSYLSEACKINKGLDRNTEKEKTQIVLYVLYAEAIITAISILIQSYRYEKRMRPYDILRGRMDAECEFLFGGNPEQWVVTYGSATTFGYVGGVFVLPIDQLSESVFNNYLQMEEGDNQGNENSTLKTKMVFEIEPSTSRETRRKQKAPSKVITIQESDIE